jgi:hypothetical protein
LALDKSNFYSQKYNDAHDHVDHKDVKLIEMEFLPTQGNISADNQNDALSAGYNDRVRFRTQQEASPPQMRLSKKVHIEPIEFESFYWLEQFLDSLF